MQDPQYRVAVAWQNAGYNQPPHPSFALDDATPIPVPRPVALAPRAKTDSHP
jgi:rhamnogalacturonan endolyase